MRCHNFLSATRNLHSASAPRFAHSSRSRERNRFGSALMNHSSATNCQPAGSHEAYYPHGLVSMSKGTTIHDALMRLGRKFEEVPLINGESAFVKPKSLLFELDGKQRRWDAVESHSSIGVVLFHTQQLTFLLVRQFRPPVYATEVRAAARAGTPVPGFDVGFTFELCAGILDKTKSLEEIASEEIEEEMGFKVGPQDISFISTAIANSGTGGAKHYMYYAEVDETMRIGSGGGLKEHGECIEVLGLPLAQTESFVLDGSLNKSPGLMFGLLWAYHRIKGGKLGKGVVNPLLTEALELRPVLPT